MDADRIDADMRDAVNERLAARLEQAATRRDARRRRLAELHARRQHGLRARHAQKLRRNQRPEGPDAPTT